MKIQLEHLGQVNRIPRYAPGRINVNDTVYEASVIVLPDRVIADWPPQRFADLQPAHFTLLRELQPEVVLLGTGARLQFPAPRLARCLYESGVGLEVMDTGAACRTYNVLVGEGRRVVAALLMIEA